MFKKTWAIAFFALLALTFAPAADSWATDTPPPAPKAGVEMPKFLRVKVYFGKGTAGDSVAEALLRGIRKTYSKINIRTIPGGSKAAVERVLANEADLGVGLPSFSYASWLGLKPFKKANTKDERWFWQIPVGLKITWVVMADSDIKSVKDLAGKRINCAAPGTGANMSMLPGALAGAGLSYEKIKEQGGFIHVGPMAPAMEMLVSGQLDAVAVTEPQPSKTLERYALTHKFRLLPMTEKELATACDPKTGNLSYSPAVIKAGTYPWLKEDIPAAAAMMSVDCRAELPDDVTYNLMAATWGCWKTWGNIHPSFKGVDFPKEATKTCPIPYHPGVAKFWKDWGLTLPTPLVFKNK